MNIATLDLVMIAVYLIGIFAGYKKKTTSEKYFLAGKSLGWFSIGSAMFASNLSTIHLIGLVMGNFEWMASFCLIALALFFAPFYFRSGISTLPEFLERRYSPTARTFLAAIAIFGALLIHIGISLFAGAKLFEAFLGIPVIWSILIISAVTVIYTVLGGLKAVVVTETIQTFLLLGGAILLTVLGILYLPEVKVHSYAEFKAQLAPNPMSMIHSISDAKGHLNPYSWLAILLGYPVLGIWYWCSNQTIVQRVLGSRTERDGQNGAMSLTTLAFQFACQQSPFHTTMSSTARSASLERNLAWYGEPYDASLLAEVRRILAPVMNQQWDYDAGVEKLDK